MDENSNLHTTAIIRWHHGTTTKEQDYLSIEEPLALEVNGVKVATLMRLPGAEKELAVGFLISERIVDNFTDIQLVSHCGSIGDRSNDPLAPSRNIVSIRSHTLNRPQDAASMLIRAGCGRTDINTLTDQLPTVTANLQINILILTSIATNTRTHQSVREKAGGVHMAALFDSNANPLISHEDIGRHNAADKVIGSALLQGINLTDKILYTTGRTSYEMVTKAAHMNIPILASKSSPTSLAVEFARKVNLTLCGFVRPHRANIYSGQHRINTSP